MLQLKMTVKVNDYKTQLLVQDTTGVYDAISNPGGWGGINYPRAATNITLFRYQVMDSAISEWIELTGTQRATDLYAGNQIAFTPQDFGALPGVVFGNGDYILEWMVLFNYVTPGNTESQVQVNCAQGDTAIALDIGSDIEDLREILQPRGGIFYSGDADSLNLIDMSKPYTATTAFFEQPAAASLFQTPLYSVGSVSVMISVVEDVIKCVMDKIVSVATTSGGCGCDDSADQAVFMTLLKFGMDINQSCGNLQGAEDIRMALLSMCNCKCGC